jgi:hypothetical protein
MMVSPSGPNDSICFIPPYREAIPAAKIIKVGFMLIDSAAKLTDIPFVSKCELCTDV